MLLNRYKIFIKEHFFWCFKQAVNEVFSVTCYVYGEGQTDDQQNNLRGELYQVYDGAGAVTTPQYDFKGNPLMQQRVYTKDATEQPDWTDTSAVPMETDVYKQVSLTMHSADR